MAENKTQEILTIEEDKRIQQYTEELKALRINGVTKVADCKIQMDAVRKNKLLEDTKAKLSLDDLFAANRFLGEAMEKGGIGEKRAIYSAPLMETQIRLIEQKLLDQKYFGE